MSEASGAFFRICVFAIATGILGELTPGESNKKIIKAVAGIYIVVILVGALQNVREAPLQWSLEAAAVTPYDYSEHFLEQCEQELANSLQKALQQSGIEVQLRCQMEYQQEAIVPVCVVVEVYENEQQEAIRSFLQSELPGVEILF